MTDAPADAKEKIDVYLDAVEAALSKAGVPRERRRSIVDDLEAHIGEIIAAEPQPITADGIEAVLARLDPPETFARSRASVDQSPAEVAIAPVESMPIVTPKMCIAARRGLICTLVGMVVCPVIMATFLVPVRLNAGDHPPEFHVMWAILALLVLVSAMIATLAGCVYGWVGLTQIGRSQGRLCGGAAAGFAALLIPIVLTWLTSCFGWHLGIVAYYDSNGYSDRKQAIEMLGGTLTALILVAGWIYFAVRLARGPRQAPSVNTLAPAVQD